jgi:hypothetical protein
LGPWSEYTYTSPIGGEIETTDDYRTPGYWKLVKEGKWLSPNEFSHRKKINQIFGVSDYISSSIVSPACTNPDLYNQIERYGNRLLVMLGTSGMVAVGILDQLQVLNLIRQLETTCMANRQSGTSNYIESLAELDQLYHMIGNPIENASTFVRDFQRANSYQRLRAGYRKYPYLWDNLNRLRKLTRRELAVLKLLASEWLRFRYGISPFISDVKAAVKTLSSTWDLGPKRHTARANGTMSDSRSTRTTIPSGAFEFYYRTIFYDDISIKAYWTDEYRSTPFDKLGLTFQNIVGVPWELTHLSFVVDWFVNVGDLIYANIPRVNVSPLGGAVFSKQFIQTTYVGDGFKELTPLTNVITGNFSDGIVCTIEQKYRTRMDGSTSLVFKNDFRLDNWIRAGDAVALLVNQCSKLLFK